MTLEVPPGPPAKEERKERSLTHDLGFIPIPRHLRHTPDKPFVLTSGYNWLFALGATITVANIYYPQPILVQLSEHFQVPYERVTRVVTLCQAGYLCGLVLLVPLGDLLPRRTLLLSLVFLASFFCIGQANSKSFAAFEAFNFLVGFCNVSPQILVPLAADLSTPARRATSVSIVLSGLIGGMVWGRLFAGIIARYTSSPLNVYWLAFASQLSVGTILFWFMPSFPRKRIGMNYLQVLWSMAKLFVTEPILFQNCILGFLSCATMVNWWTSLTFLLSGSPFNLNTFEIGLFGLTGIFAVGWAPIAGRITDKILPWMTTFLALVSQTIAQCIAVGGARLSLAPVVIICILVDASHQSLTIGNQKRMFSLCLDPKARSRINSTYMSFVFAGQATGSSAGPALFLRHGWRACYALSAAWCAAAIIILCLRGPHAKQKQWFGWGGKYSLRKPKAEDAPAAPPVAQVVGQNGEKVEIDVEAQKAEGLARAVPEEGAIADGPGRVEAEKISRA
ncbi:hypothetical protein JCM10207_001003 [Rhodosporidiobolus poonsookiae]